jgi:uncharacterized protein
MNSKNFERAREYVLNRMEVELSPHLLYHGLPHTRDDVVPSVELLAGREGISGEALILLRTAAWYHDLGFVVQPAFHEMIGARLASQVLPGFGYTEKQVEIVRWAIFATIIPQSPQNQLEQILADADLNVLGREDFLQRNGHLRRELAFFGKVYSDVDWYAGQLKFLETHRFYTASAGTLYNARKTVNIAALRHELEVLNHRRQDQSVAAQ